MLSRFAFMQAKRSDILLLTILLNFKWRLYTMETMYCISLVFQLRKSHFSNEIRMGKTACDVYNPEISGIDLVLFCILWQN
jgi:hypothetical protein